MLYYNITRQCEEMMMASVKALLSLGSSTMWMLDPRPPVVKSI